jgi:hypothetical protein
MKDIIKKVLKESQSDYSICSNYSGEEFSLCKKLNNMGTFLYSSSGLGLKDIIEERIDNLKEKVDLNPVYQEPLSYLYSTGKYNTGYGQIVKHGDYYKSELLKSVGTVLDKTGKWDFVNKLNTNYSDLSEFLTELFIRGKMVTKLSDLSDEDLKNYLLSIKNKLGAVIDKYLSVDEYRTFTRNTIHNSNLGEKAEEKVKDILTKNDWEILYSGGNGDFIDMKYFVDIIASKNGYIYTIQVKNSENGVKKSLTDFRYQKIDMFISPKNEGIVIYDNKGNVDQMV